MVVKGVGIGGGYRLLMSYSVVSAWDDCNLPSFDVVHDVFEPAGREHWHSSRF